jgi:hypothetical protein
LAEQALLIQNKLIFLITISASARISKGQGCQGFLKPHFIRFNQFKDDHVSARKAAGDIVEANVTASLH